MTQQQQTTATTALRELQELAPNVEWHVTYNYYTKLPAFTALKNGGVEFSMYKRDGHRVLIKQPNGITYPSYQGGAYAELSATITDSKVSGTGMIVSNGLPKPSVTAEMPRVNFNKYIEFVKNNLGLLEMIGA